MGGRDTDTWNTTELDEGYGTARRVSRWTARIGEAPDVLGRASVELAGYADGAAHLTGGHAGGGQAIRLEEERAAAFTPRG